MAATKRTAIQMERDRREIADLYLQGWTQQRIADRLNESGDKDDSPARGYTLSQRMISYDLKKLQEAWRESALIDIDEAKAQALAKVDRLEREYWTAWERSCEDAETLRQEGSGEKAEKVVKTTKGQAGDPRFLVGVQWCIERRCKIIGVDAPTRQEYTGKDGGPMEIANVELTDDERAAVLAAIFDAARARRDRQAGEPGVAQHPSGVPGTT